MRNKKRTILQSLSALALIISILLPCVISVFAAEESWIPADEAQIFWVETDDSRISDGELTEQIQLFDSELAAKVTTDVLPIVYGSAEDAGANDILLILDSTLGIAEEGYQISVSGNQIRISASDRDGLFYGCRNLIQQLLADGSVSDNTACPDVAERAVSLDNGRKYFSVEWIKELIREMSWSNMNTLVLHFSEEMGLGIESRLYPWLAGRDGALCTQAEVATDNTYLTQEEIAQIVDYAKLYHVEIIPAFDSPGHMNYVVKMFNEKCAADDFSFTYNGKTYTAEAGTEIGNYFHYNGQTSIVKGSRNADYSRGIDISNEIAVAFTKSLIEEYAALFYDLGCTQFDIGGDELLGWGSAVVSTSIASRWKQLDHWKEYAIEQTGDNSSVAYDAFLLYMNDLYDLVTDLGYTGVRMWNDDALRASDTGWTGAVQLNPDIDIWYWSSGSNTVWRYLESGYEVYNILSNYNYYAMTSNYFSDSRSSFTQAYPDEIYLEWNPYVFDPDDNTLGTGKNTDSGNAGVLGSAFGIWCDNPSLKTGAEVMEDLIPLIRSHAAKAWDVSCSDTVSYDDFCARLEKMGNAPDELPEAPEVSRFSKLDLTAYHEAAAEFEATDAALYTEESYAAYADAVQAARALVESGGCTQEDLDASVSKILEMKLLLSPLESEEDVLILVLQPARSRFINAKRVTLTVLLSGDVQYIEVYDILGNRIPLTAFSMVKNSDSETWTATVQFSETDADQNIYQVCTIGPDGNRSTGSVQFAVSN